MDYLRLPHQRSSPPDNAGAQQARFLDALGVPSLRHTSADGRTTAIKNNGQLSVVSRPDEEAVIELSRLCWLPEGIVITPRTAENQEGWGLPPTPDGMGTAGGDFPFVVINQYRHNNTPEYLHTVYSSKNVFDGSNIHMNLNWPINYINFDLGKRKQIFGKPKPDDAGAWSNGKFLPQFIARYLPLLSERRQGQWFCHRPTTRAWQTKEQEEIFNGINNVRLANSVKLLSPALEGWTSDLAQIIVLQNALAKDMTHESAKFSAGWQTVEDRWRGRDGQALDGFGENLYGGKRKLDISQETIAGWVASPPHFAVMTRDYTDGRRPGYASAGLGQLMAEVATVGFWKSAPYDDSFGKEVRRETSAVLRSIQSRTSRATTYQNPYLGAVSVSASPSLAVMNGTRNTQWSEKYAATYKQTDFIAVVNDLDNFNNNRKMLLGAGLYIEQGQQRMTDEAFNSLLLKKRQHDVRHNAKRVEKGKAVDDSFTGAENHLAPYMTGWNVKLRCLVYQETGQPFKAPDSSSTDCYFVLLEGAAEDYLNTAVEIARYKLPFNPATVSSTALFSEDGSKCLVRAGELTTGTGTEENNWHGEKLHFYELSSAGAVELDSAEIDVAVVTGGSDYKQTATGQCRFMPYYDGNTLKWVDMKVNSVGESIDAGGGTTNYRRELYSALVFGGIEWAYTSTNSGGEDGSTDKAVSGTVKQLLTFDPKHPERAHWIEFTFTKSGPNATTGSAEVKRNMLNPVTVQALYSNIAIETQLSEQVWLVPMYSNKSASNPAGTLQYLHPARRWSNRPESDFKASFSLGGGNLPFPAGADYTLGGAGKPLSTPIAPVSFSQVAGHPDKIAEAHVLDAFAVGGSLYSQPFGYGTAGRPLGTTDYFKSSNLDLEAITGIAGLHDNILPVWSL